ncbi:MAG: Grx4 family monothiol glutaredoxin [Oligoflexales bacterium]
MTENEALETIKNDVQNNPVFLYMKGTPDDPMCGFSAQVVHVLKTHKISFNSRNVLEEWEIREGIKKFTNWPTIPQLYVNGKFIGGCDIVMEMERKGSLKEIFK